MVINIRLVDRTPMGERYDSLGRDWYGYDPMVSPEGLWEHNRGRWSLRERGIDAERWAAFNHNGRVVLVAELDESAFEVVEDRKPGKFKKALIGRPLGPGDPAYDALIGTTVVRVPNPASYGPDPNLEPVPDEPEPDEEASVVNDGRVTSQHIGAAGELLVQYQLVRLGIDSARMTTDSGIDLVVYAPGTREATTVQVKANLRPGPAGGVGVLSRGWNFPHACPAQVIALTALDSDQVWLFTLAEAHELAQQHSEKGGRRLYWRMGNAPEGATARYEDDMSAYMLTARAQELFPG